MELMLKRYEEQPLRTFGSLYLNGEYMCDTLEDTDRHLEDHLAEIQKYKVYGKTAIPRGKYSVENYWWSKHKNYYPWLQAVPGFTGILIHTGTNEGHTLGCILVGERKGNILVNGAASMAKLRAIFMKEKYGTIEIK